jgi:hypothetical protein
VANSYTEERHDKENSDVHFADSYGACSFWLLVRCCSRGGAYGGYKMKEKGYKTQSPATKEQQRNKESMDAD